MLNLLKRISAEPPPLPFTESESIAANESWSANCGPHALAAVLNVSLEAVRPLIGNFRGWMNPTHVCEALRAARKSYRLTKSLKTKDLCNGINRIQWEGPWLEPGVPVAAAYHHTHWVGVRDGWVFDTALPFQWYYHAQWLAYYNWNVHTGAGLPWHVTHHYALAS